MSHVVERESSDVFLVLEEHQFHDGFTLMTSSKPNSLPKAPPPNIVPLGIRVST